MPTVAQECSEGQCIATAAYRTMAKPAYYITHIEERFRRGGLELLDEFDKPTSWQLMRCLQYDLEAHYRLEYIMDNNDQDTRRASRALGGRGPSTVDR